MAEIVDNEKGFKVIKMNRDELYRACGGLGICDRCNEQVDAGFYVAVLNMWLCPVCYKRWMQFAVNYPEDREIEQRRYVYMMECLMI